LLQAAVDFLSERRNSARRESETHLYNDLLHQYEHKITEIDQCGPDGSVPEQDPVGLTRRELLLETIRRERDELNLLRANGRIADGVHRILERELDLSESRLA
jgi:CPA1 family monovalent cation:H+ antiporter